MIVLDLPTKICNDCPNFKAEVRTEEMFDLNSPGAMYRKANHYITCSNRYLCGELIKSINKRKDD